LRHLAPSQKASTSALFHFGGFDPTIGATGHVPASRQLWTVCRVTFIRAANCERLSSGDAGSSVSMSGEG
jgi:hypothetical protein